MPVMAVNNQNPHEQAGDYRSRPRWSAGKKMEAVLRLLRGESLEELSRELQVEAHRLAAWRDDFLEGGKEQLKGQRPDRSGDDRALRQAERKIGQLAMENEILRAAAEKRALLPHPWVRSSSSGQRWAQAAEGQHGQPDERVRGAEPERDPGQQPQLGVDRLD
jgi:transposase